MVPVWLSKLLKRQPATPAASTRRSDSSDDMELPESWLESLLKRNPSPDDAFREFANRKTVYGDDTYAASLSAILQDYLIRHGSAAAALPIDLDIKHLGDAGLIGPKNYVSAVDKTAPSLTPEEKLAALRRLIKTLNDFYLSEGKDSANAAVMLRKAENAAGDHQAMEAYFQVDKNLNILGNISGDIGLLELYLQNRPPALPQAVGKAT